jgi:hypothetical protein
LNSEQKYIVLAGSASGNYQYYTFELDEFERFIAAAEDIRIAARAES